MKGSETAFKLYEVKCFSKEKNKNIIRVFLEWPVRFQAEVPELVRFFILSRFPARRPRIRINI